MDRDVCGSTERAVRVGVGAVRVSVRDLNRAGNDHEKDADYCEEEPPPAICAISVVQMTHIKPLYRRVRERCVAQTRRGRDGTR